MAQKDNSRSLAKAADSGNWAMVKELVCGEDLDAADIEKSFLLHKLASDTNISFSLVEEIVDKICLRHIDLLLTDDKGHTAVMAAARCNNWEAVSLLCRKAALPEDTESVIAILQTVARSEDLKKSYKLSHSVLDCLWNGLQQRKPDCQQTDKHSVLSQVGAKLNCWWLVRYLLSTDLDLNLLDEDGLGVIHRLAMGHKDQHVSLLLKVLDKGARNVVGDTAVYIAAKNSNWRMVEALLRQGARADIANNYKQTLLHILAVSLPEHLDTILALLQKVPVNIDATDGGGNTALHLAVKKEKGLLAGKLMDIGARADVVDDNGRTVLHTVASQERVYYSSSLLTRLKEGVGDLEARDSEGNTALQVAAKAKNLLYIQHFNDKLHQAVEKRDWSRVKDLIKKGANINKPDSRRYTVIQKLVQVRCCRNINNVFDFVVKMGANVNVRTPDGDNLLHLAAKHKHWPVVERLAKLGFSVYEPDSEGLCALHRLAEHRTANIASLFRLLTKAGMHAVSSIRAPSRNSLLYYAAKHGNFAMVEYLVLQADVKITNKLDSEGLSVLHHLLQYQPGYLYGQKAASVLNILLGMGANRNIRTPSGETALHLAAKTNKWNVIKCLVKHGCDVNEPDSEGFFLIHRLTQATDFCRKSLKPPENEKDRLLQFLLHKGANVTVRCPAGNTAVHLAAKHSKWNMVERLLEQGCDVREPDSEGLYIIHRLVQETFLDDISLNTYLCMLIEKDTDLSILTPAGDAVLHLAVKHNNWKLVERLVDQGCDMSTPDSEGIYILHRFAQTPWKDGMSLSSTSSGGSSEALFLKLVDKGANPLACSRSGDSVLHVAAKHENWTLVNRLLELGANINELDSEGFCILHRLITGRFKNEVVSQLDILVMKGADLNCKSAQIGTPVHIALKNKNWNLAKRLVELGADVTECDINGISVLHIIANQKLSYHQRQCIPLIQLLIEKGVDVKARCPKGDSFLHVAAKHDNWEIVEQMISHTACNDEDVNEKDSEGFTIFHRAASSKKIMFTSLLFQVLLNKGAKCDIPCPSGECALHLAVKHDNWCMINQLLHTVRASFNIDTMDGTGNTILHLCAKQRKWDQVHQLLMSGADPGLSDDEGHTILYRLAAEDRGTVNYDRSRSRVLHALSRLSVRTEEMDEFGDTLIQVAARNRNLELVHTLFSHHDHVDMTDIDGLTLLHRLVQCKSPETLNTVLMLLEENADIEVRCAKGDTALHLAAQSGNWDIVRELLKKRAEAGNNDSEGMSVLHRLITRTSSSLESDLYTDILDAVNRMTGQFNTEGKDPQLVKLLVAQGADVNAKDPNSLTPLQIAVIDSNWEMVQGLLEFCADVDQIEVGGRSIFHGVAKDTRIAVEVAESVIKQLLTRGLDLNQRDSAGETPLNLAAKHNNWRVVRAFAEVGADASIPDSEGWFVCHRLAKEGDYSNGYSDTNMLDLLSLLTSNGFEVNQKGPDGKSSLQTALKHRKWKMVWPLVQLGASYELSLDEKKTILENVLDLPETKTDQDKIKSFISHVTGKDACASNETRREIEVYGKIAFQQLVSRCNWDFAKTLVECGLDINTNISDEPLVHFVVSKYLPPYHTGWLSFLDALLARGVDINCRNTKGRTVLFRNLRSFGVDCDIDNSGSLLHVLLSRGADPVLSDAKGISLLREAVKLEEYRATAAVRFLIELGFSTHQPALTDAASAHRHDLKQSNYLNTSVRSPTQTAFEKNYVFAFKMLVESGASSNKELFELNTRYQGQLASKDSKSAEEIEMLNILREVTSKPCSLKSLCRLTVSHAIACGPCRKEKVMNLPVPAQLQDYILFCDVLSADLTELQAKMYNLNFQHASFSFSYGRSLYSSQEYYEPYRDNDYDYYDADSLHDYEPYDYNNYDDYEAEARRLYDDEPHS